MIDLRCPRCGRIYHSDVEHVGKSLKCTNCGDTIPIIQDSGHSSSKFPVEVRDGNSVRATPKTANYRQWLSRRKLPNVRKHAWVYLFLAAIAIPWALFYVQDNRSIRLEQSREQSKRQASEKASPDESVAPTDRPQNGSQQKDSASPPQYSTGEVEFAPSGSLLDQPNSVHTIIRHPQNRKSKDLGVDIAVPVSSQASLMSAPDPKAALIKVVTGREMLVLISREPQEGWYNVIDVPLGKKVGSMRTTCASVCRNILCERPSSVRSTQGRTRLRASES